LLGDTVGIRVGSFELGLTEGVRLGFVLGLAEGTGVEGAAVVINILRIFHKMKPVLDFK